VPDHADVARPEVREHEAIEPASRPGSGLENSSPGRSQQRAGHLWLWPEEVPPAGVSRSALASLATP
jgi:hypothetical protein